MSLSLPKLPLTSNKHHMITRSKMSICKPKALTITLSAILPKTKSPKDTL